jgi:hypothetical protein
VEQILVGTMVATLDLQVEVVGCPTVCRHCWAQGVPFPAMPVADVAWVLEHTHRFCEAHGPGVEHDRQVNRPGAFTETCLAIQRAHAAKLRAGANVFVTTANAGQADRLLGTLGRLQVDQMAWEPATYYPTQRGRRNERLRPQLSELLPLADRICQLSPFHGDAWSNLAGHTEAAWVVRALAGDWPPQLAEVQPRASSQGLPLVCRPGLELHIGTAGLALAPAIAEDDTGAWVLDCPRVTRSRT